MPKVSQEHLDARRRQILDGARRAFAEHGYEGATVARLEEATGLSRGAIFNYYPSKWDLFYALAQEDVERFARVWREDGFGVLLRQVATENADWLAVYMELGRKTRTDPALREQWRNRNPDAEAGLHAHLQELQDRGELRGDLTIEEIGRFLGIVVDGVVVRAAAGAETDVDSVLRLVTAAIAPQ